MSKPWFHDRRMEFDAEQRELLHIERVYAFAWDQFSYGTWERLDHLYRGLPQWGGYRTEDDENIPYWFGMDETKPPYLTAAVKPSGLVVCGAVFQNDWKAWDAQFQRLTRPLPKRF